MRVSARLALVFGILAAFASRAEATTYYVTTSGSNGTCGAASSVSTPARTIKFALGCVAAGDTVSVGAGSYSEHLLENDFAATGTAGSVITITSTSGSRDVTITNAGFQEIIRFQDGSKHHITWQHLIIDGAGVGSGSTQVYGVFLAGTPNTCCGDMTASHDLIFSDVEIKNAYSNGLFSGGANHQFLNLLVHDNGRILTADYVQGANGVYFTGDSAIFRGGEYYGNLCFGLRIVDSDSSHVSTGNTVEKARLYNNGTGKGLSGTASCGSDGGGLLLGDSNNEARNNLIYNNYPQGAAVMGLHAKTATSNAFLNNTFYGNSFYGLAYNFFSIDSGTLIENDIFWGNGSSSLKDAGSLGGSPIVCDHNILEASNALCTNTSTSDPLFTNAATRDFTLQSGSPARDVGLSFPFDVVDDFTGLCRPQNGVWDYGAYEYSVSGCGGGGGGGSPPPSWGKRRLRVRVP